MRYPKLFEPYNLAGLALKNRFLMAPMTRSRSTVPGDVPNSLMAAYYAQRSSAGIIITEATQVSLQGKGYARTPGIYSQEQVEGWRQITGAVHKKGSKIFLQLWHVGRVSSKAVNGLQPLAPSAIVAKDTSVYIFNGAANGDASFVPVDKPREMDLQDIRQTITDFVYAAINAMEAGFDGVEIHAANGYLIDQFLRSNSNKRADQYGGSPISRISLLLEITDAIVKVIGRDKVGVRLSPFIKFKDMDDPGILETMMLAIEKLNEMGIAYLHLSEADWDDAPIIPSDFRTRLREKFQHTIIATGNKTPESAEQLLEAGLVDLVGFGRSFLTTPDFPQRVLAGAPLNPISDSHTLFGGGDARGYTDYPAFYSCTGG